MQLLRNLSPLLRLALVAVVFNVAATGCKNERRWQLQDHQRFEGTLNSHRYKIDLPEGATVDASGKDSVRYKYDDGSGTPFVLEVGFSTPHKQMAEVIKFEQHKVLAGRALPPSPPITKRNVAANDDAPAEKWAFASRDHADETGTDVVAYAEHAVGAGALRCEARVHPRNGDKPEALASHAMELCLSLTPVDAAR